MTARGRLKEVGRVIEEPSDPAMARPFQPVLPVMELPLTTGRPAPLV
jgi:hypothetical protein